MISYCYCYVVIIICCRGRAERGPKFFEGVFYFPRQYWPSGARHEIFGEFLFSFLDNTVFFPQELYQTQVNNLLNA